MRLGLTDGLEIENSVITPAGVIRAILLAFCSANQTLPSGAPVMPTGMAPGAVANSIITPLVVMRPILLASCSLNHKFPSGPDVMTIAPDDAVGIGNSVMTPLVVIRP